MGEVVRVKQMVGWPQGTADVVGTEGRVVSFHPRPTESARSTWETCVWIYELEEVWCFDEEELVSTGRIEFIEDGGTIVKPLTEAEGATDPPSILLRIVVAPGTVTPALEADIGRKVAQLGQLRRVTFKTMSERSGGGILEVLLWPVEDASEYFEQLVGDQRDTGWIRRFDDGWACDFWWSRDSSNLGLFLVDGIQEAVVSLTPWNDPRRREIPADRTSDAGLPLN